MVRRWLLALTLVLLLLLAPGIPAQAQRPGAGPALLVISLPDAQALARFERTGLPAYTRLPDGSVLTGADAAGREALARAGLSFRILAADLAGGSYYVAFPAPGRPAPAWAEYGTLLLLGRDYALLRTTPDQAARLTPTGTEIRLVTHTPNPLHAGRPGAALPSTVEPDPVVQLIIDQVTTTTIYSYTGNISGEWPVLLGGQYYTITTRNTDRPPIEWAIQYTGEHLQALGLDVEYHDWSEQGFSSTNVIGEKQGLFNPDDVYIICAHLDDEPPGDIAPGADDNASGSVAVLVAADILTRFQWGCTLRFALWTGEEQGLLGSYAYAERAYERGENIVGVLNLDMVSWNTPLSPPHMALEGHPQITPTWAMTQLFSDVVGAYDIDLIPQIELVYDSGSDHASFWAFGYPAILAIEDWYDFNPYYHTVEDKLAHQDLVYYTNMVKAAVGTFAHMSGCLIPSGIGHLDGHITVEGSGLPIERARVAVQDPAGHVYSASTDAAGYYTRTLLPGTYTVTASAYGYVTTTVAGAVILSDTVTTLDIALPVAATYTVSGTVTAAGSGAPLPAEVSFLNAPVVALTDPATGYYSATVAEGRYTVRATSFGYAMAQRALNVDHDQTQDWSLQKLPCVLLVDDDQDLADFRSYYTSALDLLGYGYDVWDVRTQGNPPAASVIGYPEVVWFTGYPDAGTLNSSNEAVLSAYLDAGGSLFLVSEGLLWDRGVDGFARDRLGVSAFDIKVWDDEFIAGNAGDPVGEGLGPYMPSPPIGWPWFFTADVTTTQAAPFRWDSTDRDNSARFQGDGFKTVFLAWPLEGLPDVAHRAEVLGRVVDWFGGCAEDGVLIGRVADAASGAPLEGAAVTAEPGPFTATTGLGGHYTLTLPAGPYSVTAATPGYFSQTAGLTVPAGLTVTQDFSLTAIPLPCEPVTATGFNWTPLTPTVGEAVTFTGWVSLWLFESVDADVNGLTEASLSLDEQGSPHTSYLGARHLKYAHRNGSAWQIETLAMADYDTSLTLDSAGHPHIAYFVYNPYHYWDDSLDYATYDGSAWQVQTVDSGIWTDWTDAALALDNADLPHISYYVDSELRYAHYDGMSWITETVDRSGRFSSLALDAAGLPSVSYCRADPNCAGLVYAHNDGTAWVTETVDNSESVVGNQPSLALDSAGRPCISYGGSSGLKYVRYDGTEWISETVDSQWPACQTSLALDPHDWPHISYYGCSYGPLKYAHYDPSGWQIETVRAGNAGRWNSMALNQASLPRIIHAQRPSLDYAQLSPTPTLPITFTWSWGDGTASLVPCPLPPAPCPITHTYALPGPYAVTLTATNACGQATAAHTVVIVPEGWRVYLPLVQR